MPIKGFGGFPGDFTRGIPKPHASIILVCRVHAVQDLGYCSVLHALRKGKEKATPIRHANVGCVWWVWLCGRVWWVQRWVIMGVVAV